MTALAVTSAQFELAADESFDAFAQRVSATVASAADAGSAVVLLPELVTTSLLAAREDRDTLEVADLDRVYRTHFPTFTDDLVSLYRTLAAAHNIVVVGGSHLRATADGALRNTSFIVYPDGALEQQDKLHLTPPEQKMGIEPGDRLATFEIDGVKAAVQICADIEFPEVSRILANDGVEVIFSPSLTWNTRGAERVRIGAHGRAMENQVFVVVSPLVGTTGYPRAGAIHGTGNARVAVPLDRVFGVNDGVWAQTEDTRASALLNTTLDTDQLRRSRATPEPPGYSNVRPSLYAALARESR